MSSILGLPLQVLQDWCIEHGLPKMRARQAFDHIYGQFNLDWTQCPVWDTKTKSLFTEHWPINAGIVVKEEVSKKDGTVKWLRQLELGTRIESTLKKFENFFNLLFLCRCADT